MGRPQTLIEKERERERDRERKERETERGRETERKRVGGRTVMCPARKTSGPLSCSSSHWHELHTGGNPASGSQLQEGVGGWGMGCGVWGLGCGVWG